MYQKLLETEKYYPDAKVFRKALIHLTEDSYKVIKLNDMPNEIEAILL